MRDWCKTLGYGVGVFVAASIAGCGEEAVAVIEEIGVAQLRGQRAGGPVDALLAAEQGKLVASDGYNGQYFGSNVALFEDTAIVIASDDNAYNGDAYVFVRNGETWTEQAKFTANDYVSEDGFGLAVSLYGDTAIFGSRSHDVGPNINQGAAYVFVREGSTWTQQAKLVASDGAAGDWFGQSVGLWGDIAIVGAMYDTVGANPGQGSSYVFVRNGTTWIEQTKLTPTDGIPKLGFGVSISLSGDTAIIGSAGSAFGPDMTLGAAHIFVRNGNNWDQQAKLTAKDQYIGDDFGHSVSLSGDTAIVGASRHQVGLNGERGAAYVFVRSGTTWTEQATLISSDGAGNRLGVRVATLGDVGVACGWGCFFFERNGFSWKESAKLSLSGSFALWGNTALIGEISGNDYRGAAHVFLLGDTCATMPNGTVCDDGNACTQGDICIRGTCIATNEVSCPAPEFCWHSECNPATGLCMNWPLSDQTPCPSGVCKAGGCYIDDPLAAGGMGGSGGMSGSSSNTSSTNSSTASSTGGTSNDASDYRDIVLRGGGCHCNAVTQTSSNAWLSALGLLELARRRRRRHRI